MVIPPLEQLADADLLARVRRASTEERHATAQLIALLMEVDRRRLYLTEGCSSLFTYCTQVLHLTEHAAYGRIEAARAARRFPVILDRLHEGTLSLTAVGLLTPHLTAENHVSVLDSARHKTKRDIERLVATLHPQPDVRQTLRKLPAPRAVVSMPVSTPVLTPPLPTPAEHPPVIPSRPPQCELKALAPERFKLTLTVSRATHDKLRRLQDLLRHTIRTGDVETIVDRALTLLLEQAERTRSAATARPRSAPDRVSRTRHIPAGVKRAVWTRDGGRCTFEGAAGRCRETSLLEYHHRVPYAAGGKTSLANLELRCRAHNALAATQWFGGLPFVG
jgi:hypothetical protein